MTLKTILSLTLIATLIILSAGCINEYESIEEDEYVFVEQTPRIPASTSTPELIVVSTPIPKIINPIENIIKNNLPKHDYKIDTKLGSEIYVCSHFGCDMAENLINAGYDAGVVIDHNALHALTWINLNGTRYVIESQNEMYWVSDEYEPKHNINYVSLSKGKEFAKSSSEGLHR